MMYANKSADYLQASKHSLSGDLIWAGFLEKILPLLICEAIKKGTATFVTMSLATKQKGEVPIHKISRNNRL